MNNTRNVSISDVDNVLENVMEDDENEILNEDNNIEVEENTEDINDNSSINENTSSDVNMICKKVMNQLQIIIVLKNMIIK